MTKRLDRASPKLYEACAQSTSYAKATLDLNFGSVVAKGPEPVRIELQDVRVSLNTVSTTAAETPVETLELVFGRIVYTYLVDTTSQTVVSNYDFRQQIGSNNAGTNPDTDSDGLLDAWETANGLSVGTNDANADADGDGLTNLQEFQLGTLPKSSTSFFKAALAPTTDSSGSFQLSWNSVIGKTYVVEWRPDMSTPFTMLRTVTATSTTSTESIVNTGNLGFYRVRPQ